jgi:hypothetical protein
MTVVPNTTLPFRRPARLAIALTLLAAAIPSAASASAGLSEFAVTPSTTKAGGHPNLNIAVAFSEPAGGVTSVALHLPNGLAAHPRAVPFCSRWNLARNMCLPRTKVGSLTATAVAYGIELPVTQPIHNVKPAAGERLRLGIPIFGSYSRPGIAAELPVVERPADHGLDMAVTGLPTEVAGVPVRISKVGVWLRGLSRVKTGKRTRKQPFLTNPKTCTPAISVLDVTFVQPPALTAQSSFTPTGCR